MKRYTVLSEEAHSYNQGGQNVLATKFSVSFEAEDGYTEVQEYIATDEEKATVLEEALDAFCSARLLDPAATPFILP